MREDTTASSAPAQAAAARAIVPADIPVRREGVQDTAAGVFSAWGILAVLLVLAVLAAYIARRASGRPGRLRRFGMGAGGPVDERGLRRLSTLRLGGQHVVHEVSWRGEALLVACSERGVQLLCRAGAPGRGSEPGSASGESSASGQVPGLGQEIGQ
ncbi:hypothetical protein [Xenophilus sp.]|uniref:hypothetical protein n=1 Tax=Xenophilus sp. TaxID=1873499 RepID=UPI0037DC4C05